MDISAPANKQSFSPRGLQLFILFILVVVCLTLVAAPTIHGLVRQVDFPNIDIEPQPQPQCQFPFVYNKPPKTASTKIRGDLVKWSKSVQRKVYRCSPYTRQATFQMRECIPEDKGGCAIVATHIWLSNTMRELLKSRIGDYKLLTSTRNPADRIFSMFLQVKRTQSAKVSRNSTELKQYLSQYNPWELYNYHTGEGRVGTCPLTLQELAVITNLVSGVDIVIDADLQDVSNEILKYSKLFLLSDSVLNKRTGNDVKITDLGDEVQTLLQSVSCVEEEMHRMFRLRIASLYQTATGTRCLSNTRYPVPTCF